MDIVEKVGRLRASAIAQPMALETSPPYASASSGAVEHGVRAGGVACEGGGRSTTTSRVLSLGVFDIDGGTVASSSAPA